MALYACKAASHGGFLSLAHSDTNCADGRVPRSWQDIILEGQNITIVEERTEYIFLYIFGPFLPVFCCCFLWFRRRYRKRYNKMRGQAKEALRRATAAEESLRRQTIQMMKHAPNAPGMLVRSGTRALSRQSTRPSIIPMGLLRRQTRRTIEMPWEDRMPSQPSPTSPKSPKIRVETSQQMATDAVIFTRANTQRQRRAEERRAKLQKAGYNPRAWLPLNVTGRMTCRWSSLSLPQRCATFDSLSFSQAGCAVKQASLGR